MAKSKLTREEHNAAAMLLGMWYDHNDHTYNHDVDNEGRIYNPDTMGVWTLDGYLAGSDTDSSIMFGRRKAVDEGKIGCADGPFKIDPGVVFRDK